MEWNNFKNYLKNIHSFLTQKEEVLVVSPMPNKTISGGCSHP
jgi:hypothetical protein